MSTVHFELSADEARAVQAFLRVVDAQGKAVEGGKRTLRGLDQQDEAAGRLASSIENLAAGWLTISSAKALATGALDAVYGSMQKMADLQGELKPLFAEDQNFKRIGQLKEQVLALSAATGEGTKEIAEAMLRTQEGLGPEQGERALGVALRLHRMLGVDLPEATALTIKAHQAWGEQLGAVSQEEDKLMTVLEALPGIENPAEFLAAVSLDAKRAGLSIDELGGSLEVFTREGGRSRETISALRAMFKGLADGMEQGILPRMGSFQEKMQAIRKLDPFTAKTLFGAEAQAEIEAFLRQLETAVDKAREMREGAGGKLRQKGAAITAGEFYTGQMKTVQQMEKNIAAGQGVSDQTARSVLEWELTKRGAEAAVGPGSFMAPFTKAFAAYSYLGNKVGFEKKNYFAEQARQQMKQDLQASGEWDRVGLMELEEELGPDARKAYQSMSQKMPGFSIADFREYWGGGGQDTIRRFQHDNRDTEALAGPYNRVDEIRAGARGMRSMASLPGADALGRAADRLDYAARKYQRNALRRFNNQE